MGAAIEPGHAQAGVAEIRAATGFATLFTQPERGGVGSITEYFVLQSIVAEALAVKRSARQVLRALE